MKLKFECNLHVGIILVAKTDQTSAFNKPFRSFQGQCVLNVFPSVLSFKMGGVGCYIIITGKLKTLIAPLSLQII